MDNTHHKVGLASFPCEILVYIFSFVIESEGIVSLLDNLSQVCSSWKHASTCSQLYQVIDDPRLTKGLLFSLRKHLSRTYHLNLNYLGYVLNASEIIEIISNCPKLKTLYVCLSNIKDITDVSNLLSKLLELCPMLEKLSIQNCIFYSTCDISKVFGHRLKCVHLSNVKFCHFQNDLSKIAVSCPLLEEFRLCEIYDKCFFPFNAFGTHCPNLKTLILELDNIRFPFSCLNTEYRNSLVPCCDSVNFRNLEHFTCKLRYGTSYRSNFISVVLKHSLKLKFLDLGGINNLSYIDFPANCLETLHLSNTVMDFNSLCTFLKQVKHTLKDLDLSMWRYQYMLNESLTRFTDGNESLKLEILNLHDSAITLVTLNKILLKCPNLKYLNVKSCEYLQGKGINDIYTSEEDINALRGMLLRSNCDNKNARKYLV